MGTDRDRRGDRRRRPRRRARSAPAEPAAPPVPYDLLLFGNEAADTGDYQVAVRVAHALGLPCVTGIKNLEVTDGRARARREYRGTEEVFDLSLPAVISVKEGINLPRYPSLPGRLRAKRATIEQSVPQYLNHGGTPRACARSGCGYRPARPSGPRSSAPAPTPYPPWSPCSTSSGC